MALLGPRLVIKTDSQQADFSSPSLNACRNHSETARRRLSPGLTCSVKVPELVCLCVWGSSLTAVFSVSDSSLLLSGTASQRSGVLSPTDAATWSTSSNTTFAPASLWKVNQTVKICSEPTSLCRCPSVSVNTFITTSGNFQLVHTFRYQNVQNITGCLFEIFFFTLFAFLETYKDLYISLINFVLFEVFSVHFLHF